MNKNKQKKTMTKLEVPLLSVSNTFGISHFQ